jgi:hypothetical protein
LDPIGSLKKEKEISKASNQSTPYTKIKYPTHTGTRGVSHFGLLKGILRQKKSYENSNISPCKNVVFKKSSKRNQNHSRYYNFITKSQVSNTSKNIISQKPSYKNRPIIT